MQEMSPEQGDALLSFVVDTVTMLTLWAVVTREAAGHG